MFSKELINQIIAYWKNHFGEQISVNEAEEYLNSLADLYLASDDFSPIPGCESGFPDPGGSGKPLSPSSYT
jgi:hypothetical protein